MIPLFISPSSASVPAATAAPFNCSPGGAGCIPSSALFPGHPAPHTPLTLRLPQPLLATQMADEMLRLMLDNGVNTSAQIGWRRLPRLDTSMMVSSWGRAVSVNSMTALVANRMLDPDQVFDPASPVGYYVKGKGATSSTAAALVFATWWHHDAFKIAEQLRKHFSGRHAPAFPTVSPWTYARCDANSADVTAHNIVPWLTNYVPPDGRVTTRFVHQYAQEHRQVWLYIMSVCAQYGTSRELVTAKTSMIELASLCGFSDEVRRIVAHLQDERTPDDQRESAWREFVEYHCPSLPLVFDMVDFGGHTTISATDPHNPWFARLNAQAAQGLAAYLPRIVEAMNAPEAQAAQAANPGGSYTVRGRPKSSPPATPRKPAKQAQDRAPGPLLRQDQIDYLLNPQVRDVAELILLIAENLHDVKVLYADNPRQPPAAHA